MGIFSRHFKKRKQQPISLDSFSVLIRTEKNISEEQRHAIINIVKNGIRSGEDLNSIGILIIMNVGIIEPVILTRIKNGVEVII